MTNVIRICLGVCTLALISAAAHAQQQPPARQFGPPPELQRIAGIVGEWEIEMVHPAASGQPSSVSKTTSKIEPILGGAHFQEWNWVPVNGKRVNMTALWSYDRYRKIYRMAYLDDMHALFDPHEGTWQGDRLVLTNLKTGTWLPAPNGQRAYSRITIHSITSTRFTLEYDASLDEGKTWTRQLNCTYTRRAK